MAKSMPQVAEVEAALSAATSCVLANSTTMMNTEPAMTFLTKPDLSTEERDMAVTGESAGPGLSASVSLALGGAAAAALM